MKYLITILLFSLSCIAAPAITVKVGAYDFPPYFKTEKGKMASGLTTEVIKELNKSQSKYKFELYQTTPTNRYADFNSGKYDLIFFESKKWGWAKNDQIEFTKKILLDGEVFVAKKKNEAGQDIFKNKKEKRIAAFTGYHYAFAKFNSDPKYLSDNFKITLTESHMDNLKLVLDGKVDMAIVTYSYLMNYLQQYPAMEKELMISYNFDQRYILQFGISKKSKLKKQEFARLINKALRSKRVKQILREHNLE